MSRHELLLSFKHLLTSVGERTPRNLLRLAEATVKYLDMGRWLREHGFRFETRVPRREQVWDAAMQRVSERKVLYLEFGVRWGDSMRYWSSRLASPDAVLHGFDSFEGLPESGSVWTKGQFNVEGRVPAIADPRVKFFKGWFDQTLPGYSLPAHERLIVNLDADLYSSTAYVLRQLKSHIRPGTFLIFDELNHVEHERLAFEEFLKESKMKFKAVCADKSLGCALFECVG